MLGWATLCLAIAGGVGAPVVRTQPFWEHVSQVSNGPTFPGSQLLLLRLDVNADGRPEIFLALSEECGNGGCSWVVYSPTEGPNRVRYLGQAGFSTGGYRFAAGALSYCWHMSASECGWGQYLFHGYRMEHRQGRTCKWDTGQDTSWCDAELDAIRRWQGQAPEVLVATVPDPDSVGPKALQWTGRDSKPVSRERIPQLDALIVEVAPQ
jgi:hypothetical protein